MAPFLQVQKMRNKQETRDEKEEKRHVPLL